MGDFSRALLIHTCDSYCANGEISRFNSSYTRVPVTRRSVFIFTRRCSDRRVEHLRPAYKSNWYLPFVQDTPRFVQYVQCKQNYRLSQKTCARPRGARARRRLSELWRISAPISVLQLHVIIIIRCNCGASKVWHLNPVTCEWRRCCLLICRHCNRCG